MKNSQTFEMSVSASGGLKRNVRDDDGKFAPIDVGFNGRYGKKENDKDAWFGVADALGLQDADLFVSCCKGFAAKSLEQRVSYIQSIVKR